MCAHRWYPAPSFYSRGRGGEKKGNAVGRVGGFTALERFGLDVSGADGFDGGDEPGQHGWIGDWHVVRAEDEFYLRREIGEPLHRRDVRVEICFGAIEPDRRGIVSVAG